MKDFIQFCKSPNKKNNLISKASILLYSRLSPNLTALETIQYRPPCAFCWLPSCPIHPPLLPCVFGWLLCLFVDWGPPKTTTNFVFLIFCPLFRWPNRCASVLLHRQRPALPFTTLYSVDCANSWLVVVSPHPLEAIKNRGPVTLSLFLFFRRSIRPPQMTGKRPPPHVPPSRVASPTSHPPPTSLFGWLLRSFIEWQPPKTDAPPISQFFDGCHWGAPIKGSRRSKPEPGRLAPE